MILHVDLSPAQKSLFDNLIELTKALGEYPTEGEERGAGSAHGMWVNVHKRKEFNKEIYIQLIGVLFAMKTEMMKGNFAEMIRANLPLTHEFSYFDKEEGVFKKSRMTDIEVFYGENKPLTEEEKYAIAIQLKESILGDENPLKAAPMTVDIGKYDELVEDELQEMRVKDKKRVKAVEDINDPRFAEYRMTKEEEDAIRNPKIIQPSAADIAEYMKIIS